jgi:hypothetical protein
LLSKSTPFIPDLGISVLLSHHQAYVAGRAPYAALIFPVRILCCNLRTKRAIRAAGAARGAGFAALQPRRRRIPESRRKRRGGMVCHFWANWHTFTMDIRTYEPFRAKIPQTKD